MQNIKILLLTLILFAKHAFAHDLDVTSERSFYLNKTYVLNGNLIDFENSQYAIVEYPITKTSALSASHFRRLDIPQQNFYELKDKDSHTIYTKIRVLGLSKKSDIKDIRLLWKGKSLKFECNMIIKNPLMGSALGCHLFSEVGNAIQEAVLNNESNIYPSTEHLSSDDKHYSLYQKLLNKLILSSI